MNLFLRSVVTYLVLTLDFNLGETADGAIKSNKWCKKPTAGCVCDSKDSKSHPDVPGMQGPSGAKGEPGSPGVPGIPGVRGPKGEPGDKGAPGRNGLNASKGEKGAAGVDGTPGTPGKDGAKGEKGDKGDRGVSGDSGSDGLKGSQGEKGQPGSAGLPGIKGGKGIKGDVGVAGPSGQLGEKGEKGDVGVSGAKGVPGKIGPKGMKGYDGPPGLRGLQGTCSCPQVNDDEDEYEDDYISQARMSNGKVARACKYMEDADSLNDEFQLSKDGTKNTLFNANCEGRKTCLKPKVQIFEISYNDTKPFMSSSYRFDPRYEIEKEALLSLQRLSTNAVQYIKIHCLNSYVYGDGDDHKSRSVSFVTWNDVMLRSHPTEDNPHYVYTVDKDGCKDSAREWKVTEFVLESDKAERLPVTDIYVRDVRGEEQSLRVELGELCFD